MSKLTMAGREPNTDREGETRFPDEPQRPRVLFPLKLALIAAFFAAMAKLLP
jgi:hypothetical protein